MRETGLGTQLIKLVKRVRSIQSAALLLFLMEQFLPVAVLIELDLVPVSVNLEVELVVETALRLWFRLEVLLIVALCQELVVL